MLTKYTDLAHKTIGEKTTVVAPTVKDNEVTLESPAISVMTDFQHIIPATIGDDSRLDSACGQMKSAKIRLLFVTNEEGAIVGLVTATDLLGESPVKMAQELRIPRSDLTVKQIMTPYFKLTAIPLDLVEKSKVGHIVKTLHEYNRQHTLVLQKDKEDNNVIRGMFSNNQIGRQLGLDVKEILGGNKSLVDLINANQAINII